MDDFASKFDRVFPELQISKTCNSLLRKRIIVLERSSLDNAQYLRREMSSSICIKQRIRRTGLQSAVLDRK